MKAKGTTQGGEPADRAGLRPPTLLAVAALHIGVIAALGSLFHARPMPAPAEIAIPVIFAPAPADPSPQILAPSTLPMPSSMETAPLAPLASVTVPPGRLGELPRLSLRKPPKDQNHTAAVTARQESANQALPRGAPPATTSTFQHVAAALPGLSSQGTLHALASWEARIRQAVQDAAIYPAAARLLHREGRAQIRFDYDRGAIEQASIAQGSHFDALDSAALAAVTRAVIPAPPTELGPQNRTMLVWVQFSLEPEE